MLNSNIKEIYIQVSLPDLYKNTSKSDENPISEILLAPRFSDRNTQPVINVTSRWNNSVPKVGYIKDPSCFCLSW